VTAAIVDGGALLKVLYASLGAGVGVAVVFSLAVYGATRASEERRVGRAGAAAMFTALAVVGVACAAGAAVYGVVLVAHK
jgi:hypothetical protein